MPVDYERGLHRVGPTTHAFLQPDGGWGWSNAGLVAGADRTVLVDTFFDLAHTEELLAAVSAVASGPPSVLVNTHHNADHCFDNQLVTDATIVGHRNCRDQMLAAAPPDLLMGLRAAPGEDGGLGYMKRAFAPFDFSGVTVTPPTEVFDDRHAVDLGGRTLDLYHFGPGHTLGDIVAHLPDEGVLFAGDLLFRGSTPLVWEGSLRNWIDALDRMLALGATTIVPGHGPVCGPEGLRDMQGYLREVVEQGAAAKERGLTPLEAAASFEPGRYADWTDPERIALNMLRLYLELDGHPPETPIDPFEAFEAMAAIEARGRGG